MRFRCYRCPVRGLPNVFKEFEGDRAICPQCNAGPPAVLKLVDVHLLVPDEKGPFLSAQDGKRRSLACMPDRDQLGMHPADEFSATEDVRGVTCPACRRHAHFAEAAKHLARFDATFRIDDNGGCC